MTPAEALADRALIYRIAGAAEVDPRTVAAALGGRKGKGSSYRRTLKQIEAAGIDMGAAPASPAKLEALPGGLPARQR